MNGTDENSARDRLLVALVVFLFFAWGLATVLIDTLIPKLKGLFTLSYTEVMLTQFSFFISYFLFSIPAGLILSRIGYIRGAVLGLVVMAAGCALFSPAAALGVFPAFLVALFVMAAGITMLQVAANPFIGLLGSERTSHARLTFAQAFNSLGTTIGPYIGARLILRTGVTIDTHGLTQTAANALRRSEAYALQLPFVVIASVLVALAIVFWLMRNSKAPPVGGQAEFRAVLALLGRPRLVLGAVAIFTYVGAEVSIGSLMTNYLMQPNTLAARAQFAGELVSLYWGGAMIGRFAGSLVLWLSRPGYVLAACAVGACTLAVASSLSLGVVAAVTLIAVGLFNSIMFPTIFSLASEGLGEQTPNGSGLLCMAIVGGALVPLLTGAVADAASLATSLFVPAVCYVWIAIYGVLAARGLGLASPAVTSAPATQPG
jgi:FHS family L-fucose permease-like MFS transporter